MASHTLISSIRNHAERVVTDLRDWEAPPEVKVYDLQGNLKRIEPPPTPDVLRASIKESIGEQINGRKREKNNDIR